MEPLSFPPMTEEVNIEAAADAVQPVPETGVSSVTESPVELDAATAAALARRDEAVRLQGNALTELAELEAKLVARKAELADVAAGLAAAKRDVEVELEAFAKAQAEKAAAFAARDAAVNAQAAALAAVEEAKAKEADVNAAYDAKDLDLQKREAQLISDRVALEAEKADVAKIKALFK